MGGRISAAPEGVLFSVSRIANVRLRSEFGLPVSYAPDCVKFGAVGAGSECSHIGSSLESLGAILSRPERLGILGVGAAIGRAENRLERLGAASVLGGLGVLRLPLEFGTFTPGAKAVLPALEIPC